MNNPYAPPGTYAPAPPQPGADLEGLRNIATYQRWINLAILAQIAAMVVLGVVPMPAALDTILRVLVFLVVGVGSLVAEALLVNALHGRTAAILCAPLMFVPCVNLIALLLFNQQATGRLRKAGFKVGLLGGNPNDIR